MRKKLIRETILKSLSIVILMLVCMAYNYVGIQAATDVEEIETDTEISGSVDVDEVKYYKFVVSKTGYFNVSLKSADALNMNCPNFSIFDSENNTIASYSHNHSWSTSMQSQNYAFKKGTELYIKVTWCNEGYSGNSEKPEEYKLTINEVEADNWEQEYNNTIASATEVISNKEYNGQVVGSEDVDYYKFVVSKTGYFNISMNKAYESDKSCPNLTILDSEYATIASYNYDYNHYSSMQSRKYAFKKGTELYIKITWCSDGYSSGTENYKFTINEVESGNWEKEYNDTANTANEISLNKEYYGQIMYRDDIDYYKFTLSQPSTVNWSFRKKEVSDTNPAWGIYLINDKNEKIGDGGTASIQKNLNLPKGTYYICVQMNCYTDSSRCVGLDYKLKLTSKPINTKAPTIKSIKSAKKNIIIKWNKQNDGSKYAVTVGTNKKFSGKTGKFYFESSSTGGKLTYFYSDKWGYNKEAFKKKKTYYVKVNKYYEDAFGNVHNGKSVIKKVTIK